MKAQLGQRLDSEEEGANWDVRKLQTDDGLEVGIIRVEKKFRDYAGDGDIGTSQASSVENELPKMGKVDVGSRKHRKGRRGHERKKI